MKISGLIKRLYFYSEVIDEFLKSLHWVHLSHRVQCLHCW